MGNEQNEDILLQQNTNSSLRKTSSISDLQNDNLSCSETDADRGDLHLNKGQFENKNVNQNMPPHVCHTLDEMAKVLNFQCVGASYPASELSIVKTQNQI